ncbi:unnamed protein product [Caenorhabditis auriculariae]|uniref:Uncharacterized protein n=1 Tax=Caenorhabditis auriculariae TaxID=2777116 RepID=A0A8S1HVI7_9PELO|nr:unnamed protein product [Caenorhabditis auriculariae]
MQRGHQHRGTSKDNHQKGPLQDLPARPRRITVLEIQTMLVLQLNTTQQGQGSQQEVRVYNVNEKLKKENNNQLHKSI